MVSTADQAVMELALGAGYDGPNYKDKKSVTFPKIAGAKVEVGGVTGEAKADAKAQKDALRKEILGAGADDPTQ